MTLYKKELSPYYNEGIIEELFHTEDYVLCVLGGKRIAAIVKSKSAYTALGCYSAFMIDGVTAEALARNKDLFIAKSISRQEPFEDLILLNDSLKETLEAMLPLSSEDAEKVAAIKNRVKEKKPISQKITSLLSKTVTAPLTRTVFGILILLGALISTHFEKSRGFSIPLFCLAFIFCLFPIRTVNVFFKKSSVEYDCDRCGKGDALTAVILHQLVCILFPFIRIPYKIQRRTVCKSCYLNEKEGVKSAELLSLLNTNIIRNEKRRKKGRRN